MSKDIEIQGFCDDRFEAVKTVFMKNFKMGRDVGASFAATIDGDFVIDMWAGYADAAKTRPWEENIFGSGFENYRRANTRFCGSGFGERHERKCTISGTSR